ncbi:MAG: sarcosine oxidase subunit alpha family protein [Gammaproteobacteria bacterium]|nr:sarcosine oxidase subunit alpha family protein [Gammaproteobacteria bacterium]MDH4254007.1 sarcosine oxidase subunit alpha family protein [Gammaproteobacteria bacterium]MDH5311133.1 sarcosine oxidase subunit alpha family protein [Gammaproteobacteria bacterium]
MSAQPCRLAHGGRIDRAQALRFSFDGRAYTGYAGDTLASALLANGVSLLARSFKYHRPRGIHSAGAEEPNALVTIGRGARREPNTRATAVELVEGLEAYSQNAWPSLGFDLGAVNNLVSPFFSAGFYYKTFMWPGARGWRFYERFIRRAAGMGAVADGADPDRYERIEEFCDLLVVGSGPAGTAAALTAARSGARVLLVDENAVHGGAIARGTAGADDALAAWHAAALGELRETPEVTVLERCSAFGYYDGNVVGLVEHCAGHRPDRPEGIARQRHWIVRAQQVVLATGAIERPLLFGNNDLPGIMLANAGVCYLREYAVCAGRELLVYTNNDSAYAAALAHAAFARVAVVDTRQEIAPELVRACAQANVSLHTGSAVATAVGSRRLKAVRLVGGEALPCDLLLTSAGWNPTIALHSQAGGRPVYDGERQCFLPGSAREAWIAAGACSGAFDTGSCLAEGRDAAQKALARLGVTPADIELPDCAPAFALRPGPQPAPQGKCFVDLQTDATTDDIELAVREGYASAELLKRYTALGMGTEQGKTSNVNALALLAARRKEPVPAVGVTSFRPPYTPVTMAAIAGRKQGARILPTRQTPLLGWHEEQGALLGDAGLWKRALAYPERGETRQQAAIREARHVRSAVGVCDVSTLGKLDIQGPDACALLERACVNRWSSLALGKARYGVMLQDDGFVFDDGTTSRIGAAHYFMTTTTDRAEQVLRHLEFLLQVLWPALRVHVCDATEQWAGIAVAGPRSRELLLRLFPDTVPGLPFMGVADAEHAGLPVRILRVSFSGELGYELYVPSSGGEALLRALCSAGDEFDVRPYGLDAMDILRIEKGHLTGSELDGNRTLADAGLARLAREDEGFIGAALSRRPGLLDPGRPRFVGLEPLDPAQSIRAGAHLVAAASPREPDESLGHVSSACFSPALGRHIGLGFLAGGDERQGSVVHVADPLAGTHVAARVVSPCFVDPAGERLRA